MKKPKKNRAIKLGIQGKLTLIFILLSTLPLILVSIYSVQQQIKYKQEENLREMESDIKGLKERTSLFLTRVESELNLVMKSTELKKLSDIIKTESEIDDQLRQNSEKEFLNIITDNDFYIKIDLLNGKGKEVLSVINDKENPYAVEKEFLSRITKNFYVQIANDLEKGEIDLSPSEIRIPGNDSFLPVIDFILPFYDLNDKISSIVTVKIRAEKLFELLVPSYENADKKIFIVNGEGYYIFNSERKDNWSSLFTQKFDDNLFKDYSTETASEILSGKEKVTLNYKDRIIQCAPIFSGSKAVTNRYFIVEDVDADIVLSSTSELKLFLSTLILFAAIASVLAGILTAKNFLRPIKKLIKGTEIIRSGNLDYQLNIKTKDEIQDLISNFNQLVNEWRQKQILEKEIQKSEKLFSSLAQTASDAIIEIDHNGIAKVWNEAASKIFGFAKEEILGKNIINLIVPENSRELAKNELEKFLKNDSPSENGKTIEVIALRKDGTEFSAELSVSSVNIDGERYATGIIRDITQRKKLMEELVKAKENAEVADKLKSEFLNQMSHEIRTPLNILLNVSEYIHSDLKDKKLLTTDISEGLKEIKNSGERIIRTVELILNMSEIQAGSYKNNSSLISIEKIIYKIFEIYKEAAEEKNLEINYINFSKDTLVKADPYSIEQILSHIFDNAVKFTNEGFVKIKSENDKENLIISVEDSGIGISEDYLSKIFTPFSQEYQGASRSFDGNGLGLALVKKLCEMNNILINVYSEKGKGSRFELKMKIWRNNSSVFDEIKIHQSYFN